MACGNHSGGKRGVVMKDFPTVTVCGCGNAGMAIAADRSLLGYKVNLYESSHFKDNLDPIRKNGGILLTGNTCSGKTGLAKLNKITDDAEEAIEDIELILIAVPAMAVDSFVEALSPYLVEGQTILVNTGYWASLRSKKLVEKTGALGKITFVEETVMPYLSSKIEPAHVHIYNFKRQMKMSAWPATKNETAYKLVKKVYPEMQLSKNVLENNFYTGNPAVHAQITIPKAAFFFERAREFRFYGEVSMCASKLMDAFDKEKNRVAAAFGCDIPSQIIEFRRVYGYKGKNRYEIYRDATCPHTQLWSSDVALRQLLREDLCYFFVPMEQLAEVVGVDVPVTKAIIEILQIFTDFDYRTNGITLKDLGLEDLNKDQIIDYVTYGHF
jgi:opine dehydrogenase